MTQRSRSEELEHFKTKINLVDYAQSHGFIVDRKNTSKRSAVLKHDSGDKLVVARNKDNVWVYFNVHGNDKGTVIDLVQQLKNCSLGEVRKELRSWSGTAQSRIYETTGSSIELLPSSADIARVRSAWLQTKAIGGSHKYLETQRKIPQAILSAPKFEDRIRIDRRFNAVFPHFSDEGLCGFEIKNTSFTGFAPGGTKSLWCSRPSENDHTMVIAETAIDALSVATLLGVDGFRFFSTAGQISPLQAECLKKAARNMPACSRGLLAMDNDAAGRKLAQSIREHLSSQDSSGLEILNYFPPTPGQDWNDVLVHSANTTTLTHAPS
jgi:hypothetical protein